MGQKKIEVNHVVHVNQTPCLTSFSPYNKQQRYKLSMASEKTTWGVHLHQTPMLYPWELLHRTPQVNGYIVNLRCRNLR